MSKKIWCVIFTDYEDDYKHRYDSGVYPSKPELFSSEEAANTYIALEFKDRIEDRINDQLTREEKDNDDRFYKKNNWYYIKADVDLEDLYEEFMKGEYVDYLFDYEIEVLEQN